MAWTCPFLAILGGSKLDMNSQLQGPRGRVSRSSIALIGCATALSVGFLDVALTVRTAPLEFGSIPFCLLVSAVTASAILAVFLALVSVAIAARPLLPKLRLTEWALGVASFLLVFFLFGTSYGFFQLSSKALATFSGSALGFALVVSLNVGFLIYSFAGRLGGVAERVFRPIALLTPLALAQFAVLLWLVTYRNESTGVSTHIAFGFLFVTTVVLVIKVAKKRWASALLGGLLAANLTLGLAGTLVSRETFAVPSKTDNERASPVPRVVLVTIDTLRQDYLSAYNPVAVPTPNMDALARDGVLFESAFSTSPWTKPAMASILTGLPVEVHGVTDPTSSLAQELPTLAEHMLKAGYRTAAIVRNPFLGPKASFSQGFMEYEMMGKTSHNLDVSSFGASFLGAASLLASLPKVSGYQIEERAQIWTPLITERAREWIEENHGDNFFLWIHYLDPHIPYAPPSGYRQEGRAPERVDQQLPSLDRIRQGNFVPSLEEREWIKELYAGEVRFVDHGLGRVLDLLKRLDIYDTSLVILTSDHGEEFWEHGGFEHGHSLYNELLRVPLIIKLPKGFSSARQRVAHAVSTQDLMATILDLCDISYDLAPLPSHSLVPLWGSSIVESREPLFSAGLLYYEDQTSVIFDQFKYVRFLISGREHLYNLEADPAEQKELGKQYEGVLETGRSLLARHQAQASELRTLFGLSGSENVELDDDTIRSLKALGYISEY